MCLYCVLGGCWGWWCWCCFLVLGSCCCVCWCVELKVWWWFYWWGWRVCCVLLCGWVGFGIFWVLFFSWGCVCWGCRSSCVWGVRCWWRFVCSFWWVILGSVSCWDWFVFWWDWFFLVWCWWCVECFFCVWGFFCGFWSVGICVFWRWLLLVWNLVLLLVWWGWLKYLGLIFVKGRVLCCVWLIDWSSFWSWWVVFRCGLRGCCGWLWWCCFWFFCWYF